MMDFIGPPLGYLILQKGKDFEAVIRVPNQMPFNKPKGEPDLIRWALKRDGALSERRDSTPKCFSCWPWRTKCYVMRKAVCKELWMARSWEWPWSDSLQENRDPSPMTARNYNLSKPEWSYKRMLSLRWNHSPGQHFNFNVVRPWAVDLPNLYLYSWPMETEIIHLC